MSVAPFQRKLAALLALPLRLAGAAAPRLEAAARARATTSRGYVPPVRVSAGGSQIVISGPGWAVDKAAGEDGARALTRVLEEEARRAFREV